MLPVPTLNPKSADVLFTATGGIEQAASVWVQRTVDSLAVGAEREFTHVALAVSESVAIEAVPEPSALDHVFAVGKAAVSNEPKLNPKKGAWTGVDLNYGVRFIPIEDILIGATAANADLVVLRNPSAPPNVTNFLDLLSLEILSREGSRYSIEALKQSLEAELPNLQTILCAAFPNLASEAQDLKTKCQLTADQWKQLEDWAPQQVPKYQPRSYFCSQLVWELLGEAGIVDQGEAGQNITPIGMFRSLHSLGWQDVAASHYSPASIEALRYDKAATLRCQSRHLSWLARNKLKVDAIVLDMAAGAVKGAIESVVKGLDDMAWKAKEILRMQEEERRKREDEANRK